LEFGARKPFPADSDQMPRREKVSELKLDLKIFIRILFMGVKVLVSRGRELDWNSIHKIRII
jgi:hypothetical protein